MVLRHWEKQVFISYADEASASILQLSLRFSSNWKIYIGIP